MIIWPKNQGKVRYRTFQLRFNLTKETPIPINKVGQHLESILRNTVDLPEHLKTPEKPEKIKKEAELEDDDEESEDEWLPPQPIGEKIAERIDLNNSGSITTSEIRELFSGNIDDPLVEDFRKVLVRQYPRVEEAWAQLAGEISLSYNLCFFPTLS